MTHLYEKQRLIYSTRLLLVSIADKICCVGPNVFCVSLMRLCKMEYLEILLRHWFKNPLK